MNAEDYARVKKIFFGAIDLPPEQRTAFVENACGQNKVMSREVQSLLAHHVNETLLPMGSSLDEVGQTSRVEVVPVAALRKQVVDGKDDGGLVLAELWSENRSLLTRRLRFLAGVLAVIIGYAVLMRAVRPDWKLGLLTGVACLAADLVCYYFLARRNRPTLPQIRLLEVLIMLNVGTMLVVNDFIEMQDCSVVGNLATIQSATQWNFFCWSMLILTYGVFVPNTWRRAAGVLLPLAAIPYLVDWLNRGLHPVVEQAWQEDEFGLPLPMPFIAAGIAISAAGVIHGARLAAFHAQQLVQYQLIRKIGSGGMGSVYEAKHVLLERPCAVKIVLPELSENRKAVIDFEREVRATCELSHPNTIEIYDFGQTHNGLFFYVMELLPGCNLRELVQRGGPLPPPRAIHLLVQVCGALSEAHGQGLVHRDIKPANIFASVRGGIYDFAKLLDFGLVRQSGRQSTTPTSRQSERYTAGTPAYMSPEQIVNFSSIDARSDIYSLGAVAYYLVTGQPPFPRATDLEVFAAHASASVVPPNTLRPEIGVELNQIILKCLEKSAGDRYDNINQLLAALQACSLAGAWTQAQAAAAWGATSSALSTGSELQPTVGTLNGDNSTHHSQFEGTRFMNSSDPSP